MTRAERARDLFFDGCNCAQAVFLAFAEDRMDQDTALKIASGYGGGMAGMRGICGAVNGMFMAYGLLRVLPTRTTARPRPPPIRRSGSSRGNLRRRTAR